jgi:conserved domain protein
MEKEKVLEIEFMPIWDKWAWKVMKNKLDPGFEFEYLKNSNANIIRLNFGFVIDDRYLINDSEKEKLEKSIKAINEKYGIPKRWRANFGGEYCFIDDNFSIKWDRDKEYFVDNRKYEFGNYLKSKEEAKEYAEYMKKCSLEWHEKRDNNG